MSNRQNLRGADEAEPIAAADAVKPLLVLLAASGPAQQRSALGVMSFRSAIALAGLPLLALVMLSCASAGKTELVFTSATNKITMPFSESGAMLSFAGHPTLEASINGVRGRFIIDTGAPGPLLTATAVRRCGLLLLPSSSKGKGFWGDAFPLKKTTNVTVRFTPDFAIHYAEVLVSPEEGPHFGLLDYGTLRSAHAIMDMDQKTVTVTP
jgi:hypothetical protein